MKIDEIPSGYQYIYRQTCDCGKDHCILTKRNNCPEYETLIYIFCDCGEYVMFEIPIN